MKFVRLLTGLFVLFPLWTSAFYDVSIDDPQNSIFQHLQDVGIMGLYPDGGFHPEKVLTRAEALIVALRAGGITIPADFGGQTHYNDVEPNQWYAPAVARALETRVIIGKGPSFRPNHAVSKAEFLAFLFRATHVDFDSFWTRTRGIAEDIPMNSWFAPHFAYAKKYQVAHLPPDNYYRPHKVLSRREIAMMTYRQLRLFHGDHLTRTFVELQGKIQQFIVHLQNSETDKAEALLPQILKLNMELTRTKNNTEAIAAQSVSRAMTYITESLRYFRNGKKLAAIENLHLASKQTTRAAKKSEKFLPFVNELARLIDETMQNYINPNTQI